MSDATWAQLSLEVERVEPPAPPIESSSSVGDRFDPSTLPLAYFPFEGELSDAVHAHELPARAVNGAVGFTSGVTGGAARFDGSGAAVEVDGVGGLPITDEMTLELWVNVDEWKNPYQGSAHIESIVSHSSIFTVAVDFDTYAVHAALESEQPVEGVRLLGGRVSPRRWHHIALVYRGANASVTLYLDGDPIARARAHGRVKLDPKLELVMGTWYKRNQAFSGLLDEVRLWGVALPVEVLRTRIKG